MHLTDARRQNSTTSGALAAGLRPLSLAAAILCAAPALAHALWIETPSAAKTGQEHGLDVCWGHSGSKETGEALQGMQSKLSALLVRPDGTSGTLNLTCHDDGYSTAIVPAAPGFHVVGSELQTGIIDSELHGIPANTRIIMYAKSLIHVLGSDKGLDNTLGFDLEIVPVTDPASLRPGDVVTVKVLLKGKSIGGRDVMLTLGTTGPQGFPDDLPLQTQQWTMDVYARPPNGDASFPLIAGGPHVFSIRYFDENPGTYEGELNESSSFSHLRKGDTYERTMYVSTLTLNVEPK